MFSYQDFLIKCVFTSENNLIVMDDTQDPIDSYITQFPEEIRDKLSHPRLYITTLDGIGGCGKTALALKTAYDFVECGTASEAK